MGSELKEGVEEGVRILNAAVGFIKSGQYYVNIPVNTITNLQDIIKDQQANIEELEERLEIGFAFDANGNEIEAPDVPDGIACRNETIAWLEDKVKELKKENELLRIMQEEDTHQLKRVMDERDRLEAEFIKISKSKFLIEERLV